MRPLRADKVTLIARSLQQAGLIRYRRGTITIADRKGLEAAACECYDIVRHALDDNIPPRRSGGGRLYKP